MQLSVKFAVLAFVTQVAVVAASPMHDPTASPDMNIVARATQRECEEFCTTIGLLGPEWQDCVEHCVSSNYPSPPSTPHHSKPQRPQKPSTSSKRPGRTGRPGVKRATQQECEDFCTSVGLFGAQWQQCVDHCVSGNYPSPPPTPHHGKPQKPSAPSKRPGRTGRPGVKRATQQECEEYCTAFGLAGQAWQDCVDTCVRFNYPSPPPTPHHSKPQKPQKPSVPSKRPGRAGRPGVKRATQQECEEYCTSFGLVGPAWQECVDTCVSFNYPSPPTTPHHSKSQKPKGPSKAPSVKPGRRPFRARDMEDDA